MQIRRATTVAASFLALTPWAPAAHAAPPRVEPTFTVSYNRQASGGWLAVVGCKAVAMTGGTYQVALATQVTCSVNQTSRSQLAVGPAATTQVTLVAPLGPVIACVSGKATLMDSESGSNQLYLVTAGPTCIQLPNTG